MYDVYTNIGIISQYQDTGIDDIEEAKDLARAYYAQGYDAEVRDTQTGASAVLLLHTVTNSNGVDVNYETAVSLMDDDIREAIHATGDHDDDTQGFFDAYAAAHLAKYGETWELDKPNPCY